MVGFLYEDKHKVEEAVEEELVGCLCEEKKEVEE